MNLKVFGSSSKGNGYALTDSKGNTLLLECGVPVVEVKKYLYYDLSKVVGCLVTHSHGDHSKFAYQYLDSGIDLSMSKECAIALDVQGHHRVKELIHKRKYSTLQDEFTVMPIEMNHDVHCFAYLIQHEEMGNTLFMTDTFYSSFKFANVNNWVIECNFSERILDGKLQNDETHKFLRDRIISSHLSLENLEDLFDCNDMTQTNNIVLIHLSSTNSDAKLFKEVIYDKTIKNVHIASKGLEIPFNKTPF